MKKLPLIFFVICLLVPSMACSTVDMFKEKVTLAIISPDSNLRLVENPHEDGSPTQANLLVEMHTNKDRYILATIYVDGVPKAEKCNLAPNDKTNCGTIDLYNMGQHTVSVEITTLSGENISSETTILWEPYIGWDAVALKIAQVANSNDPTIGFIIFGIMFVLIFSGVVVIKNQTAQGAIVGIFVSTLIVIAMFIYVSPEVASNLLLALLGIVSSSIFAGVVIYAMSQGYEVKGKDGLSITTTDADGKTTTVDYKGAPRIGPGNGESDGSRITKAFFEATSDKKNLPVIEHYIDGELVSEEQYQIQRHTPNPVQPAHRRGFMSWISRGSRKTNNHQRRLR